MQYVLETLEGLKEDTKGEQEDGGNITFLVKERIQFEPTGCLLPLVRRQQ